MIDKDNSREETVQEENIAPSTIFDDVFRTIAQKMPFLLIPLINEVFHTDYREDQEFSQLRNEHYEKYGKIITDSILDIGGRLYHIECQSEKDGSMVLRMIEYDFAIAVEHSIKTNDVINDVFFPESCVLYIRNHRSIPEKHEVRVHFSDGQTVIYSVPVLKAQDYTVDGIFEKDLLALLPYHILRYESFLKSNSSDSGKTEKLLNDFRKIQKELETRKGADGHGELYMDMVDLISQIVDHVVPESNPVRERIGEIMGGRVLQLKSEKCREEGMAIGDANGRLKNSIDVILNMRRNGLDAVQSAKLSGLDAELANLVFGLAEAGKTPAEIMEACAR